MFKRNFTISPLNEQIDVLIPVIEKDLTILPLCLEGIKYCVTNPIRAIYIVAPELPVIKEFCEEYKVEFVNERNVLGYCPKDIDYVVNGQNRSGWIFQQLLKLSGNVGECENYLVIDADHILIRSHTFISEQKKYIFYRSKEFHPPYYQNIYQLTGKCYNPALSYVAHKMIFNKSSLQKLKKIIENKSGKEWDKTIIECLDKKELSSFSEYELYGNFFPKPEKRTLPWRNKNLRYSSLQSYDKLQDKYAGKYRTITFPEYINH